MGLTPTTEDRDELRTLLQNEILMFGLEGFFNEFSVRKLQSMAFEMGLSIPTSSKQILVSCIVGLVNYEPPVRPKKMTKKNSKKKIKDDKKKKSEDSQSEKDEEIPEKKQYSFDYEFSSSDEEDFVFSSADEESDEPINDSEDDVEMCLLQEPISTSSSESLIGSSDSEENTKSSSSEEENS